jgi:hypothetical protein
VPSARRKLRLKKRLQRALHRLKQQHRLLQKLLPKSNGIPKIQYFFIPPKGGIFYGNFFKSS